MHDNEVKWRQCQMPGCDYKEIRSSRQGDFVGGRFVCPKHAEELSEPSEITVHKMRDEWERG